MKKIKKILSATFFLMIIIPVLCIGCRIMQYQNENKKLNHVSEIVATYTTEQPAISMLSKASIESESFIDIYGLQTENPDVVGFVEVHKTPIAYPVMKSQEPDYYIRRGFDKKRSIYGSIYMDNACYQGGTNLVLYGHNMKSGKMFGTLRQYLDAEYRETHKEIRFVTQEKIACYEVCAVFTASATDEALIKNLIPYTVQEMEALNTYLKEHGNMSEDLVWGDQLITLATCEYTHKNGRLFVIGKLTDTIHRKE